MEVPELLITVYDSDSTFYLLSIPASIYKAVSHPATNDVRPLRKLWEVPWQCLVYDLDSTFYLLSIPAHICKLYSFMSHNDGVHVNVNMTVLSTREHKWSTLTFDFLPSTHTRMYTHKTADLHGCLATPMMITYVCYRQSWYGKVSGHPHPHTGRQLWKFPKSFSW